jgi:hypothetical protein
MKKFLFAIVAVAGLSAAGSEVQASGCSGPYCQSPPQAQPQGGFFHRLFVKQPLPAFQAAPWYNYWPYNAHFQSAAPLPGTPSAYPYNGLGINPYFPAGYPNR